MCMEKKKKKPLSLLFASSEMQRLVYFNLVGIWRDPHWRLTLESENEDREQKELSDHEKSHPSLPNC